MKTLSDRLRLFFKSIWNSVLGIFTEVALVYVFIISGFLVCLVWWLVLNMGPR